jgi:NAD(P)-dependent dehydrogenase (short-subunit alcohol dehydrogenase family)
MPDTVFILSASADIGRALATMYADEGRTVIGTSRDPLALADLRARESVHILPCDVGDPVSVARMVEAYAALGLPWDVFVSAVGVMDPIGPWTSLDFDAWEQSVTVNSLGQLRVLHGLYPHRRTGGITHAAFFAGGGTNNPFTNYSAYCLGKIALIKMCELLDDEVPDLNAFIIGPGFLPTKIHEQTFANPVGAGDNLDKTRNFHAAPGTAASYRDLYDCIGWCVAGGRPVAGGRNFSAAHDVWKADGVGLADRLRYDVNMYKLRRAGNASAPGRGEESK